MQREILFRGQRADNGEWVYGYYVCKSQTKHQIVTQNDVFPINVISETVGQFTGLTDKNGTKIFEGDKVRYTNPYSKNTYDHICLWDEEFACFGLFEEGNKYCQESDWVKIIQIEVIGNIHKAEGGE